MKDAFGISRDEHIHKGGFGPRALQALSRGPKQGLRMVAAQKGFDPRKAKSAFVPQQRGYSTSDGARNLQFAGQQAANARKTIDVRGKKVKKP